MKRSTRSLRRSARLRDAFAAAVVLGLAAFASAQDRAGGARQPVRPVSLDARLARTLAHAGFTGRIESTLEKRLGRPVDPGLASLGRDLFFDKILGLHGDDACAGCHSPTNGFGDTQSIAIGIQNNNLVGPGRTGPRNQRRTPMVINNAFFPKLMWNGRFRSPTGDPFDNSQGFAFPPPESTTKFLPSDDEVRQLLVAQAHIPPTEQTEVAGFTGAGGPFDDGLGTPVPKPDASGFRNEPIREAVLLRVNAVPAYRDAFARRFLAVAQGGRIDFRMLGQAIAEFEFSLTFANAPIDRFARGERGAMTDSQKRGALLFFGRAGCVRCHAVAGPANEMFSDFEMHAAGVPQLAPLYGVGTGDVTFAGPEGDEDYGLEDITGHEADRYKFRTSPLRNLALQPAFFHDGAFVRLEDAVRFHLGALGYIDTYDPAAAGVVSDLSVRVGPREELEDALDPLLRAAVLLTDVEFGDLVAFLRDALLDDRARPGSLRALVPESVPSGMPMLEFQFP
jgi:cytochrome c peroxidase